MKNDYSKGPVWKHIVNQAIPLALAQLVLLLYNVVDRIYIGHLAGTNGMALTGIGLIFPIVTLIAAFTNLFGMGGSPLFSIERGRQDERKAGLILGNVFSLLLITSIILMIVCYIFEKPIIYLFGASDSSYYYAHIYLMIYLIGTPFAMLSTGLNSMINAQGFPKTGMLTTIIGALVNIALDPIFIFALGMGVRGAALATIIAQGVSCIWVLKFLFGKKALIPIKRENMKIDFKLTLRIMSVGLAGFIVQGTNALVQIVCNTSLQSYGGDLYVGMMTVLNSVRELFTLPVMSIGSGAQPVSGYNYGAKKYSRLCKCIKLNFSMGFTYTVIAWAIVFIFPKQIVSIFTSEPEIIRIGTEAIRMYFFGFCFMAFQFAGQSTFQSLGFAKRSIFFSLFRKVIIVVPLTLLLPRIGFGVEGVYMAEPISNLIGGLACFTTMYFTVYRKFKNTPDDTEDPQSHLSLRH